MSTQDFKPGDVVSFQGPITLGGGLTAQVDYSQKWIAALNEDGEPRRLTAEDLS